MRELVELDSEPTARIYPHQGEQTVRSESKRVLSTRDCRDKTQSEKQRLYPSSGNRFVAQKLEPNIPLKNKARAIGSSVGKNRGFPCPIRCEKSRTSDPLAHPDQVVKALYQVGGTT